MSTLGAMVTMTTNQCNEIVLGKPTLYAACDTSLSSVHVQLVNLTPETGVLTVHFLSKDVTPPE